MWTTNTLPCDGPMMGVTHAPSARAVVIFLSRDPLWSKCQYYKQHQRHRVYQSFPCSLTCDLIQLATLCLCVFDHVMWCVSAYFYNLLFFLWLSLIQVSYFCSRMTLWALLYRSILSYYIFQDGKKKQNKLKNTHLLLTSQHLWQSIEHTCML